MATLAMEVDTANRARDTPLRPQLPRLHTLTGLLPLGTLTGLLPLGADTALKSGLHLRGFIESVSPSLNPNRNPDPF